MRIAVRTMRAPRICGSQARAASRWEVISQPSLVVDDRLDLLGREDLAEAGHAASFVAALAAGAVRLPELGTVGDEVDLQRRIRELPERRAVGEVRPERPAAHQRRCADRPALGVAAGAVRLE